MQTQPTTTVGTNLLRWKAFLRTARRKPSGTGPPAAGGGGAETKETMTAKVKAKGAALKKEKGAKGAGIKPLLDELTALKKQYAEVAGEPWPVSAQQ